MSERVPLYASIATELPGLYRRDGESWRQVQEYLALVDVVCRRLANQLVEVRTWLSPAAMHMHPPGAPADAAPMDVLARQAEALDEVAGWLAFRFPPWDVWALAPADAPAHPDDATIARARGVVRRKAELVRRLPRLMRERTTPRGFLALFCAAFGLEPTDPGSCPVLIEHFAAPRPEPVFTGASDAVAREASDRPPDRREGVRCLDGSHATEPGSRCPRVTLLLPGTIFRTSREVAAARRWVGRNAPAHVPVDVWRVARAYWDALLAVLATGASSDEVLAGVRAHVGTRDALRLGATRDVETPQRLDIARLPGTADGPRPRRGP